MSASLARELETPSPNLEQRSLLRPIGGPLSHFSPNLSFSADLQFLPLQLLHSSTITNTISFIDRKRDITAIVYCFGSNGNPCREERDQTKPSHPLGSHITTEQSDLQRSQRVLRLILSQTYDGHHLQARALNGIFSSISISLFRPFRIFH